MMLPYLKLLDYMFACREQLQSETRVLYYTIDMILFLVYGGSFVTSMLDGAIVAAAGRTRKFSVWFIYTGIFTLCVYALLKQQVMMSSRQSLLVMSMPHFAGGFALGSLIPVIRLSLKNRKHDT